MPAMRRAVFPALLLALLGPAPCRAQFYDLDGAYRCFTAPDAGCAEHQRDQPPEPATKTLPEPSLDEAIAHVRQRAATPEDMRALETRAAARDPRAVEVLAWCRLNGIGAPADALAAYWLYREAAELGVANARKNQIAIYESRLAPEQRQQVLLKENAR